MSESNWKDRLSSRCLYVYSDDRERIRAEELVGAVDGVVEAISIPDPADQRGGNRFIVLLNNEENKKCLENHGIIYQGRRLNVESSNNTCDIPNEWERFVQPLQYPSGQQTSQENDVYANMPNIQNIPMPSPQQYIGQQMAAPPGQQNPMNPGHYPFMHPFYMQGIHPNMYPQEGAVGQNVPPEAGNIPYPQQLWLQQMQQMQQLQLFYQMHGGMPGTEGATAAQPPPYTPTEEKSSSMRDSLESTATKSKQSYSDLQSSDGESVTPSAPDEEVQGDDESVQETSKSEAAMIKVTNIPDGTSKDSLLFFFENRRKSGGGSVEDLEYDPDTKSAVITFEDPEAVKRVIGKLPILFNGVQIGVEEFRPDVRVDNFSEEPCEDSENIMEVRGVSSRTSDDTVMMYFENTRRSGGGEIKSMKSEDGVFYIIFEDDQAIEKVLKKQHKIDGTAIKVCRYVPPPPPKPVPLYSNKVFITNISEKTTKDGLENFLEAKTNITPVSIEYGELEGTALITFEEDIGEDVPDLAMSQHHIECQTETCRSYSEFYCNSCHQRMCCECRDQHLKHPDSSQHEVSRYEDRTLTVSSVPCKLHPRQQLTLCCKKCQQAICALCTTIEHDGHGFLNLEKVYTKNYKTRIEEIRRIRDDVLPKSRLRLKESKNATLEAKENVEMLKNSMKEQANRIKGLVDDILTKNLQDLQRYEASTVEKLENQEKVMDSYVNRLQTLLEEYKHSISSSNPTEFLPEMSNTPIVDLDPIPEVNKESPRNFSGGKLNKDEISRQFGKLT